jgi:MYXO-CTERM domain-containing protein
MRSTKWLGAMGIAAAVVAASFAAESDARACGGCFAPPGPSTQVSAHRMAFAISPTRTVLWDQIEYVGEPSSFGWVLPIRSAVDVGVSSDELFTRLDNGTQPQISPPPPPECPPPDKRCRTTCGYGYDGPTAGASDASASDSGAFGFDTGSVDVWGTSVVGPYEATQLSASDGTALRNWLTDHGYVLPDAIAPIVDAYVGEGFGFLAVKLVPGAGVSRMVPIRIAFDGASPTLPLRMVAAGTGAEVGIKLFVLGEGRWEAQNFDNGELATSDLVWDWRAMASNVNTLENNLITSHAGRVWIAESSESHGIDEFFSGLPPGTTTGDADATVFSSDTDQIEIGKAFPTRTSVTVTRLFAQLPSSALASDLQLQASTGGTIAARRQAPVGINYVCPTYTIEVDCPGISPVCDNPSGGGWPGGGGTWPPSTGGQGGSGGGGGCNAASTDGSSLGLIGGAMALMVGVSILRRRRGR